MAASSPRSFRSRRPGFPLPPVGGHPTQRSSCPRREARRGRCSPSPAPPEPFIAAIQPLSRPASSGGTPRTDPDIDPDISCAACDAVCCRLTVVLLPGDDVPERLTTWTDEGLHVMAHDEDGWCVAVDGARHCCSIYESRPAICRKFAMGGPYCRAVRAEYAAESVRAIPLALC